MREHRLCFYIYCANVYVQTTSKWLMIHWWSLDWERLKSLKPACFAGTDKLSAYTENNQPPSTPKSFCYAQRCSGNGIASQHFLSSKHEIFFLKIKFPIVRRKLGRSCFLSILVAEIENLNCVSYLCSVLLLCGKCWCCVLQKCQCDLDFEMGRFLFLYYKCSGFIFFKWTKKTI